MGKSNKNLIYYRKKIVALLKGSDIYKPGLEPHILALATALRNLDKINADIDNIEHCVYTEKTAYGTRIQENPLFGMAGKQLAAISRAAKPLGLDSDKLLTGIESDPLVELTKEMLGMRENTDIIKPDSHD